MNRSHKGKPNSDGGLHIDIDISDWYRKVLQDEDPIRNEVEVVEAITRGQSTADVASAVVALREIGHAERNLISPNKILLLHGAMSDIHNIVHRQKMDVHTAKGKITTPALVGKINGKNSPETIGYYPSYSPAGTDRAIELDLMTLHRVVKGYITNRLARLYKVGYDIYDVADGLKKLIDKIVLDIAGDKNV